jgi:phage terminase large subunit
MEPFILEKMYPAVETEVSPGVWKTVHTIQPHQRKLHDRTTPSGKKANRILFSGGVGNGKSHCVAAEMFKLLRTYPGIKIVATTAYDYYITEFMMPTWEKVLPEDSPHIKHHNRKDKVYLLTNGSQIRFKAYDDPDKIRGWECHVLWIEEGAELGDGNNDKAYAMWQNFQMRLRCSTHNYPLLIYVTQNPKGHNWIWKVFIKTEPGVADQPLGDSGIKTIFGETADGKPRMFQEWEKTNEVSGDVFYSISTGTSANAYVPPGYVASMLGQMADSPELRARMVEGEFTPINALVYDVPIYSERTHVVKYQNFLDYWDIDEIPSWWRVAVGIDCGGQRSPWAIEYYVQTEDGHWVCFNELYQAGLTWGEIADMILHESEGFERIEYWIDPISSNHKSGPTSDTIREEFTRRGIPVRQPKGYNKMSGILRVQNFLRRDHTRACPYLEDVMMQHDDGTQYWEVGHAQLYYLTDVPGRRFIKNPDGHACPGNIAEKRVYRYDSSKNREPKAHEEGLTPMLSEKLIDRDDHAQTAEMFFALGVNPLVKKQVTNHSNRQTLTDNEPVMYGRRAKHRRL